MLGASGTKESLDAIRKFRKLSSDKAYMGNFHPKPKSSRKIIEMRG